MIQATKPRQDMDMMKLIETFPDEGHCRSVLEKLRWPSGIGCPRCGSLHIRHTVSRNQYDCADCGYQFSVISGTIFHDTHLPLRKWIVAVYLMVESKKGMSANQIKRTIGVSYKTAWYLCHRIREAMTQAQANAKPLSGIVEADETFVGGKAHGMGRAYKGNKAIVVGVVQRQGEVRLQVAENRSRRVLQEIVLKNTVPETEAIYTDEWVGYSGLGDEDTRHETVNHSIDEYVRGDVHTNSVEGVWSLLKRSIVGSYHHVSVKHLPAYVEELEWRFSQRDNPFLFRDTLRKLLTSESLPYRDLTAD